MRACRKTPSAHTYTYRRADKSRPCQRSYSRYHSAVSRDRGRQVWRVMFGFEEVCEHMSKNEQVI